MLFVGPFEINDMKQNESSMSHLFHLCQDIGLSSSRFIMLSFLHYSADRVLEASCAQHKFRPHFVSVVALRCPRHYSLSDSSLANVFSTFL